jgi:hypothetical protein
VEVENVLEENVLLENHHKRSILDYSKFATTSNPNHQHFLRRKSMKIRFLAMVIVLIAAVSFVNAAIVSNSLVVDDIEYYIETNDSMYDLGENVEMLFRVTNLRNQDVDILCSRDPEMNFLIQQNGETVWSLMETWFWYSPGVEILAGESEELIYIWDKKDSSGIPLGAGVYDVFGVIYNEPWNDLNYGTYTPTEVGVEVTIIPEPCSILILGLGGLLLRKRSKQ